jgi:hypothetical protein
MYQNEKNNRTGGVPAYGRRAFWTHRKRRYFANGNIAYGIPPADKYRLQTRHINGFYFGFG